MGRQLKLAVVTSIPTPYRDPFWNVVAAHPDVESLDVYFCAKGKPDRPWSMDWGQDFNPHFLPSYNLMKWAGADSSAYWVSGLQAALAKSRHDAVIVGGYNHPSMLQTIRGCVSRKQPFFMMCETYKRRSTWKSAVKDRLLNWIFKNAAGGMPTGKLAGEYLRSYGLTDEQLIYVPNVPDVMRLKRLAATLAATKQETRAGIGLPNGNPVLTFVGRMIPKKRPELVIRAFAKSAPTDAWLVMLGDGPLMPGCKALVNELGISERTLMPGFCQPGDVPEYLSISTAFVLPSSETWGVAAIEAVAMGIPTIVSDEVGCHPDLIVNDDDGAVVRAGDLDELAHAIGQKLTGRPSKVGSGGTIDDFSYDRIAGRLIKAVDRITTPRPEKVVS